MPDTSVQQQSGEVIVVQYGEVVVSTCDTCPDLTWDGLAGAIAAYRHTEETTHTTRTVQSRETYRGWAADAPESGEPAFADSTLSQERAS